MKVLMLAPYSIEKEVSGGAENHIKNLIISMADFNDIEIHVITISRETKNIDSLKQNNVKIHLIKKSKVPMTISGIIIYPLKILTKIKEIDPDVLHGQMVGAPYGLVTGILSKTYPTILTIHTLMDQKLRMKRLVSEKFHDYLWLLLENWELKVIRYHIIVSPHLKKKVISKGARKVSVIPNGIDLRWFEVPDRTIEGRILFVGRITPIKGIENLIKSVAIIINKGYGVHARIVGPFEDLNYKKDLINLSRKLNVLEYIDFVGGLYGDHLLEEYSKCSVFVLPSFDESNPIVLLEAMAAGKIIIATGVGGIPYLIRNHTNGFLVDYGDNQKMAETIIEVIKNKENYKRMSEAAKKTAKQYQWKNVANKTYNLYKEVYKNYHKNG